VQKLDLTHLGNRIFTARKNCGLTQQELAKQTGLSVKTVQDIEKGRKNPTYETLARLIERLAISPDTLFFPQPPVLTEEMQSFFEVFQSCDLKGQRILLKTLYFLAEQIRTMENKPD